MDKYITAVKFKFYHPYMNNEYEYGAGIFPLKMVDMQLPFHKHITHMPLTRLASISDQITKKKWTYFLFFDFGCSSSSMSESAFFLAEDKITIMMIYEDYREAKFRTF